MRMECEDENAVDVDEDVIDECMEKMPDIRSYNVGSSDYSKHLIQPWDIWLEYALNPFDADIVKRVLRRKRQEGKSAVRSRIEDYQKIIHVCQERIRQLTRGCDQWGEFKKEDATGGAGEAKTLRAL